MIDIDIRDECGQSFDRHVDADGTLTLAGLRGFEGQAVRVTIMRAKLRTPAANRYLWGAVYPFLLDGLRELAANAGEVCPFKDKNALHRAMKHRFKDVLGTAVTLFLGEEFEDEPTTRVPGPVFALYIERMSAWAAERGICLPQPGEYGLKIEAAA